MTWLTFAFANLRLSPLTSTVNVALMALGTASIVLLLLLSSQLSDTLARDARGIDLVIGAQGSPAQLVLAAVYHADVPPGNIAQKAANQWASDPRVGRAIPLSLGDSFRGYRIVGTTPEYAELYQADLAAGAFWRRSMEAVIGATAAASAGLGLDDTFTGAHGLSDGGHSHDYLPYRVVGVLEPTGTVLDRLILTSLDSVWLLHDDPNHDHAEHSDREGQHDHDHDHEHEEDDDAGHDHDHHDGHDDGKSEHGEHGRHSHSHNHNDGDHGAAATADRDHDHGQDHATEPEVVDEPKAQADRDITAMLISYRTPLAAMTLPRDVNAAGTLLAAAPAMEIARILQLVGIGLDGLRAFAWVLIATAALSVFAALYGSLRSRRGDLAMLRCLGATRLELLLAMLLEGILLTVVGVAIGFAIGHGAMELLGSWLESTRGVALTGWTWLSEQTWLLVGLFGVGVLASAIPAMQAYRTDVASELARG